MRLHVWIVGLAVVACLAPVGCKAYVRTDVEGLFAKVQPGMTRAEVIGILGEPSRMQATEMFFIYDDPPNPARLRIVLNDQDIVIAKYYESRRELAKKAEEVLGQPPTVKPLPGDEKAAYPGAPLERFAKKPGEP
jgi:hypothetical protein